VLADYGELEPVVERALAKRAARGINLPKLGAVDVKFGDVTIYATENGRLAVGVPVRAKLKSGYLGERRGEVWLTGLPFNEPDSEVIRVDALQIKTRSDSKAVDLMVALFTDPETIGQSLDTAVIKCTVRDEPERTFDSGACSLPCRRERSSLGPAPQTRSETRKFGRRCRRIEHYVGRLGRAHRTDRAAVDTCRANARKE